MKTRNYTTGLVVSFFFAAAIAATLHAPAEAGRRLLIRCRNEAGINR